jgi:hypothetical protein
MEFAIKTGSFNINKTIFVSLVVVHYSGVPKRKLCIIAEYSVDEFASKFP